jgi:hypothetical protein
MQKVCLTFEVREVRAWGNGQGAFLRGVAKSSTPGKSGVYVKAGPFRANNDGCVPGVGSVLLIEGANLDNNVWKDRDDKKHYELFVTLLDSTGVAFRDDPQWHKLGATAAAAD